MANFRRCVVCEEKFVAERSTARYCSDKCRQRFYRYMQHERVRLNIRSVAAELRPRNQSGDANTAVSVTKSNDLPTSRRKNHGR